jgi:hypothetical protein
MSGYWREETWSPWFVTLWIIAILSSTIAFWVWSTRAWAALTGVEFMTLEIIGLLKSGDGKPPLTYIMRRYVPRWLAFPLLYFLIGSQIITAVLAGEVLIASSLVGFLGWTTSHFDITYTARREDGWPPKLPAGLTGEEPERKG